MAAPRASRQACAQSDHHDQGHRRELGTGLTGTLLQIVQASEPLDRVVGYRVDDKLIGTWTDAVAQLRASADAKLPNAHGAA